MPISEPSFSQRGALRSPDLADMRPDPQRILHLMTTGAGISFADISKVDGEIVLGGPHLIR